MKLYTEKELRKAIGKSRLSDGFVDGVFQLKYTIDEVLEQSLPIELPSDDDMANASNHCKDGQVKIGFLRGVLWYQEQILNQNK